MDHSTWFNPPELCIALISSSEFTTFIFVQLGIGCHSYPICIKQQQEFQLGQLLRKIYLDPSSPTFINGINHTFADQNQIHARADAGGEGGVIFNSALSLLQGLYPANQNDTTLLANGTSITSPLGGYQVCCKPYFLPFFFQYPLSLIHGD